jgi:hypothetical protein
LSDLLDTREVQFDDIEAFEVRSNHLCLGSRHELPIATEELNVESGPVKPLGIRVGIPGHDLLG